MTFYVCQATGSLQFQKYHDLNANGVKDPGEEGLPMWKLSFTDPFGSTFHRLTDENGYVFESSIPIGDYVGWETLKPGWVNATPLTQTEYVSTDETFIAEFGNYEGGCIGDYVYYDDDQDGQLDGTEGGIDGVTLQLFLDSDGNGAYETLYDEVTTNVDGYYLFENLPEGSYLVDIVEATLPAGQLLLTPPPEPIYVEIAPEECNLDVDFGYFQCGPELCDGIDNDCDGEIDEDYPLLGDACDTDDSDLCANGHFECFPPAVCRDPNGCNSPIYLCVDDLPANILEVCDGADNDCDRSLDENMGTTTCGVGACEVTVDNDCDGAVDEDLGTTTCGTGACEETVDNCVNGQEQTCIPGTPADEGGRRWASSSPSISRWISRPRPC